MSEVGTRRSDVGKPSHGPTGKRANGSTGRVSGDELKVQSSKFKAHDTRYRMQKSEILMSHRISLNPESWILYPGTTGKRADGPTGIAIT